MTLPLPNMRTWASGEDVGAGLLNAQLRDVVKFLMSPPRFVGTVAGGTAVGAAIMSFTVVEDNWSAWATNTWTAPFTGWYRLSGQIKANASGGAGGFTFNRNGVAVRFSATNSSAFGGSTMNTTLKLAAGDTVQMQSQAAFTTMNDGTGVVNTFFEIQMVGV